MGLEVVCRMKLIQNASKEKLRGGFYTPEPIAQFILRWAVNGNKNYDILEPSCGDGVFLEQIKESSFAYKTVTAVELDTDEAKKTSNIKLPKTKVLNEDFFSFANSTKQKFDLIIGNPPYIRYQYFNKDQREEAIKIFSKADLKYSKLSNAWVGFVVGATQLLKEKGKIGFVLPAEILQVGYAKQLRNYLAHTYNKINIVSFKKLVFSEAQQEVVLLLCEKNGSKDHLIEHLEVEDASRLQDLDVSNLKSPKKKIDFKSNKWTFYFLSQQEINFIEKLLNQKTIKTIKEYAKVEVGMTTGSNDFFTVNKDVVDKYELEKYTKPLVGRSVQVSSSEFNTKDWKKNVVQGAKAFFLLFPTKNKLTKKAKDYLAKGEEQNIHKLYKCSIRNEWQIVPSAWISDALFIRRNNIYPRLILNKAKAFTTDTMHRVTIRKDVDLADGNQIKPEAFIASYYNSLSFAFAEISGRSHGGGVLELMPSEVESVLLPYNKKNEILYAKIDEMLRDGKTIDEVLEVTDKIILKERAGLSDNEIRLANKIWKKLLNRRIGRNSSY